MELPPASLGLQSLTGLQGYLEATPVLPPPAPRWAGTWPCSAPPPGRWSGAGTGTSSCIVQLDHMREISLWPALPASSVNLPAPEKTDSTLAAALFSQPTSRDVDCKVESAAATRSCDRPRRCAVEPRRALVVLVIGAGGSHPLWLMMSKRSISACT